MKQRPEYDPKVIGENLKRLRKAKSLSVNEVKEYLRLGSVQAIYKYESGKGYPQVDTMFALMELYEASLNDIIHGSSEHVRDLTYIIWAYSILDNDIIFEINIDDVKFKQNRNVRLKKYLEFYPGPNDKGIAS